MNTILLNATIYNSFVWAYLSDVFYPIRGEKKSTKNDTITTPFDIAVLLGLIDNNDIHW